MSLLKVKGEPAQTLLVTQVALALLQLIFPLGFCAGVRGWLTWTPQYRGCSARADSAAPCASPWKTAFTTPRLVGEVTMLIIRRCLHSPYLNLGHLDSRISFSYKNKVNHEVFRKMDRSDCILFRYPRPRGKKYISLFLLL